MALHVNTLLSYLLEVGGSDLHLTAGSPPQVRVHGQLRRLDEYEKMMPAELRRMVYGILTVKQREKLEENLELDASHPLPGQGRFRLNVFFQRDALGAVFRAIPEQIMGLNDLGIPPVVGEFADMPRGLVLVTGPTGSGKSTTLAAIIDMINRKRACHILTVEDPIEFLHSHKRAIVNQREVGADTMGFQHALRHALRQDPDVILVGELRDLETISTALTAAETGHLVFATLHTQDAPQTIDRIVDVFPSHQQEQVRVQLAATLQAVVTQQLVPTRNRDGRVPAVEVMIATPAIRNLIRESKIHQITTAMQAGGRYGMQTMDQSLADLVKRNLTSFEIAAELCSDLEDLQRLVGRVA
ncbi:MAG: type IV pilus twitching motility protein PilT [Acidimicrobiia bacterium]|nr:type IV pilus twitching motility protein PilT [Acidimicrobiia bacterium]